MVSVLVIAAMCHVRSHTYATLRIMRKALLLVAVVVGCSSTESSSTEPDGAALDTGTASETSVTPDTAVEPTDTLLETAEDTTTPLDAGDTAVADVATDAAMPRDFSTDRAKFFGASRCATAKVQLCEDFESGTLDTKTWTVGGTAPTIEGGQKARGAKALHITKVGNGNSTIKESKTFPAVSNRYWARMFVRFEKMPAAPMTYAHWTIAAATGSKVAGEIRIGGQFQSGKNIFGVGTDNRTDPAGTGDWTTSDKDPGGMPRAAPLAEWMCLEWLHDGEKNETKFFWDGTEHPSMATTETKHGGNTNPYILPQFNNLWFGWAEYQAATETFEMWIDEIAVDSSRIGCVL